MSPLHRVSRARCSCLGFFPGMRRARPRRSVCIQRPDAGYCVLEVFGSHQLSSILRGQERAFLRKIRAAHDFVVVFSQDEVHGLPLPNRLGREQHALHRGGIRRPVAVSYLDPTESITTLYAQEPSVIRKVPEDRIFNLGLGSAGPLRTTNLGSIPLEPRLNARRNFRLCQLSKGFLLPLRRRSGQRRRNSRGLNPAVHAPSWWTTTRGAVGLGGLRGGNASSRGRRRRDLSGCNCVTCERRSRDNDNQQHWFQL